MLRQTESGPAIVLCNTCRFSATASEAPDGRRGGALFVQAVRRAAAASGAAEPVLVEEMPCLFACDRHCTAHLRAPGRIGYVLGGFAPTGAAAQALVDFFLLYRDSAEGRVPYRQWPEGVKGHFIVRLPPPGHIVA